MGRDDNVVGEPPLRWVAVLVAAELLLAVALDTGPFNAALPLRIAELGMGRPRTRQLVRSGMSRVPSDSELSHSSRMQTATAGRKLSSSRAARQMQRVSVARQVDDFCTQLATQKGSDRRPAASAWCESQSETRVVARGSQLFRNIAIADLFGG